MTVYKPRKLSTCPSVLVCFALLMHIIGTMTATPAFTQITGCDDGWVPAFNSCYYFNTGNQFSWVEARQECAISNADLMIVRNKEEMKWINVQTEEYSTDDWWVGLAYGSQGWTWVQYGADTTSINWRSEPDNYDDQDCGAINEFGAFSDEFCDSKLGFICTYSINRGEFCPYTNGWFMTDKACYYVSQLVNTSQHLSWEDAKAYCRNLSPSHTNIQLLRVPTSEEMALVIKHFSDIDTGGILLPWWTGLNDIETEGNYVWQDGTAINASVISWDKAPSSDHSQHKDCGVMYQGGTIDDMTCDKRAHYVCEKPSISSHLNDGCGTWTRAGHQCYWFAKGKGYTWSDARNMCQRAGSDLLKLDSLDERYWIRRQSLGSIGFWIGLNDNGHKGTWSWADGTPSNTQFINWSQEPNNAGGQEYCVEIKRDGTYNDLTCTNKAPYICEYSKDIGVACPSPWVDRGSACYYFSSVNESRYLTWYEVKDACSDLVAGTENKAYRLAVNDKDEQKWLNQKLLQQPPESPGYWIGLNDIKNHGIWQYDEDFNSNYDQSVITWAKEPNNFDGKEDCVVMYEGGALNDVSCTGKAFFICEKSAYSVSAGVDLSSFSRDYGILSLLVPQTMVFITGLVLRR